MALEIKASRKQQIASRIIIALLVVGILATLLISSGHTRIVRVGNITTYTSPASLFFSVQFAFVGLAACILGIFYGRQRNTFFRLVGMTVFAIGLFCLFNSPTGLNHRLVVTPDYFFQRIGSWYSPMETRVDFKEVKYMYIDSLKGSGQKGYELRCDMNTNAVEVRIEINDLMKAALPEIYTQAAAKNIPIGDSPNGQQIPSDL